MHRWQTFNKGYKKAVFMKNNAIWVYIASSDKYS